MFKWFKTMHVLNVNQ